MGRKVRHESARPKLDPMSGLHADDCACARCEAGYRPTIAQRWAAKRAHDLAAAAAKAVQLTDAQKARASLRAQEARERLLEEERATDARVKALREAQANAWVPTDEELAELRRANGLPPPPRKGNRP